MTALAVSGPLSGTSLGRTFPPTGWSVTATHISRTLTEIWVIRPTFILQMAPTTSCIAIAAECSAIPPMNALFFVGGGLNVAPRSPTRSVGRIAGIGLLPAALWPQAVGQIRAVAAEIAGGDGAGLLPLQIGFRVAVVRATRPRGEAKAAVAAAEAGAGELTFLAAALWPQPEWFAIYRHEFASPFAAIFQPHFNSLRLCTPRFVPALDSRLPRPRCRRGAVLEHACGEDAHGWGAASAAVSPAVPPHTPGAQGGPAAQGCGAATGAARRCRVCCARRMHNSSHRLVSWSWLPVPRLSPVMPLLFRRLLRRLVSRGVSMKLGWDARFNARFMARLS